MNDTLKRLKDAVAHLKGKRIIEFQKDIVEKLDMNKATVSQALNGNEKYLTESFLGKFCEVFTDISLEWLLTGKGEMLLTDAQLTNNTTTAPSVHGDKLIIAQQEIIDFQKEKIKELQDKLKRCEEENFFKNKPVPRDVKLKE